MLLKKIDSTSSQKLLSVIAPQLGVESVNSSQLRSRMLIGLVSCRSCPGRQPELLWVHESGGFAPSRRLFLWSSLTSGFLSLSETVLMSSDCPLVRVFSQVSRHSSDVSGNFKVTEKENGYRRGCNWSTGLLWEPDCWVAPPSWHCCFYSHVYIFPFCLK